MTWWLFVLAQCTCIECVVECAFINGISCACTRTARDPALSHSVHINKIQMVETAAKHIVKWIRKSQMPERCAYLLFKWDAWCLGAGCWMLANWGAYDSICVRKWSMRHKDNKMHRFTSGRSTNKPVLEQKIYFITCSVPASLLSTVIFSILYQRSSLADEITKRRKLVEDEEKNRLFYGNGRISLQRIFEAECHLFGFYTHFRWGHNFCTA